ncbi:MAG: hypothetical protein ABR985_13070 [Methanotrichaceae archaeon]|jgi:hypothetical protein
MARNLALWVVKADNASQIRSLLDVSDENVSPQALEMLHEAMKKMIDKEGERQIAVQAEKQMLEEKGFSNGKGLSDNEKKSIRYASMGFLDDLEKISGQVDRVMDYIPEHAERLMKFSDMLETYAWSLQSELKYGTEINDTEIFEARILRTYANSFQVCIEIYKITTDAIMELPQMIEGKLSEAGYCISKGPLIRVNSQMQQNTLLIGQTLYSSPANSLA